MKEEQAMETTKKYQSPLSPAKHLRLSFNPTQLLSRTGHLFTTVYVNLPTNTNFAYLCTQLPKLYPTVLESDSFRHSHFYPLIVCYALIYTSHILGEGERSTFIHEDRGFRVVLLGDSVGQTSIE